MSEIKVDKISPNSGTNLDLGDSGKTFTVPNGAKIDAASGGTIKVSSGGTLDIDGTANFTGATVTLDANELSGDTIDGGTISNFASTGIDDNANAKVLEVNNSATNGIKVTRPFWAQTACLAYGRLTVTTDGSGIATAAALTRSFNCNTPGLSAGTITVAFTTGAQATSGPNSTSSVPFALVTADAATKLAGESVGTWSALTHSQINFTVDGAIGLGKIKFPINLTTSTIDFLVFNPAAPEF
jgi:hypothetical protein